VILFKNKEERYSSTSTIRYPIRYATYPRS